MSPRVALPLACLLALGVGCSENPERRLAPSPEFTPAGLLPLPPELAVQEPAAADLALGGLPLVADTTAVEPTDRQAVALSGLFTTSIPLEFQDWQWATDGRLSLVLHETSGRMDALIYAEAFDRTIQKAPSLELRRFHATVDPGLSGGVVLAHLALAATLLDDPTAAVRFADVLQTLFAATTRTMGRGLGYRSARGTFTGWRWVGRNDHDVHFRIARTHGVWSEQAQIDEKIRAAGEWISEHVAGVGSVDLGAAEGAAAEEDASGVPAFMVLGSVVVGADAGIHLAMLCTEAPTCPVREDLVAFLERIEPDAATAQGLSSAMTPTALASSHGIELLSGGGTVPLDRLPALVAQSAEAMAAARAAARAAAEASGGEGTTPGAAQPATPTDTGKP
ncbi:MAG: hypothetical protein ABIO70_12435 [Pseudomonadota bacterium]